MVKIWCIIIFKNVLVYKQVL